MVHLQALGTAARLLCGMPLGWRYKKRLLVRRRGPDYSDQAAAAPVGPSGDCRKHLPACELASSRRRQQFECRAAAVGNCSRSGGLIGAMTLCLHASLAQRQQLAPQVPHRPDHRRHAHRWKPRAKQSEDELLRADLDRLGRDSSQQPGSRQQPQERLVFSRRVGQLSC